MLVELTVENIAIIERSQIDFGPGFTALTGETGAGKSLLVDAIELALGVRADSELVRTGASKGTVSVVFDLSTQPEIARRCAELGISLEDQSLFVSREVYAEGRSQCRVNGKLTPVSALKSLGQYLIDLHGQHDHQSLLDAGRHIGFLDGWIGADAASLLSQIERAFEKVTDARRRLAALRSGMRDRERRLDLLRFQTQEIEAVDPKPGEMDELLARLSRLKNAERLATSASLALEAVQGDPSDAIRAALKAIEQVVQYDPELEAVLETLTGGLVLIEEGARDLSSYADSLDSDPMQLEEVAGRIDALKTLRRKYGEDETAVLAFLTEAERELELLADSEASEESLASALAACEETLRDLAQDLSLLRKEKSIEFAERVQSQLRSLAVERALFEVSFRAKEPDASGMDEVEFFFSANAGEAPRPLSKIASGGEISRVMLGIKTALAGRAGVPTLIFDEVDTGLGGKAAATVARKLQELAAHVQVIVISHLPQIAARSGTHFRIEKLEAGGRVTTRVRRLGPQERVDEIARMLAGDQVTPSAIANARDMLALGDSALLDI